MTRVYQCIIMDIVGSMSVGGSMIGAQWDQRKISRYYGQTSIATDKIGTVIFPDGIG